MTYTASRAKIDTRTDDDGGRMLSSGYNNGVTQSKAYNNDNTLSSIAFTGAFTGASIGDLSYGWDVNKNKTSEGITGTNSGYGFDVGPNGYDDEDRLANWNRDDIAPTQVSDLSSDFDNRLLGADTDGDAIDDVAYQDDVAYRFDATGRRVARVAGSGTTVFLPSGGQTIADYPLGTTASLPTYNYVYADYIDQPVMRGGGLRYYHRSQQFSITAMTDGGGTVVERYAYDAYGTPTFMNGLGQPISQFGGKNNRYLYTGREWIQQIQCYYYRARVYCPELGRFVSKDPIGFAAGDANLYRYVGNQPTTLTDPSGLAPPIGPITGPLGRPLVNKIVEGAFDGVARGGYKVYLFFTDWHLEGRDQRNDCLPTTIADIKDQTGWIRKADWVRLPPGMSVFHDNGIGGPEVKYVNRDGREAIYDGDTGELITNGPLRGTYNYAVPVQMPECWLDGVTWIYVVDRGFHHTVFDVVPYMIGGNDRGEDPPFFKP